jgi:K+-transporting ATPase KdpF subunit
MDMDWENLLALLTAVALVGYLIWTLVHPERF